MKDGGYCFVHCPSVDGAVHARAQLNNSTVRRLGSGLWRGATMTSAAPYPRDLRPRLPPPRRPAQVKGIEIMVNYAKDYVHRLTPPHTGDHDDGGGVFEDEAEPGDSSGANAETAAVDGAGTDGAPAAGLGEQGSGPNPNSPTAASAGVAAEPAAATAAAATDVAAATSADADTDGVARGSQAADEGFGQAEEGVRGEGEGSRVNTLVTDAIQAAVGGDIAPSAGRVAAFNQDFGTAPMGLAPTRNLHVSEYGPGGWRRGWCL